MKRVLITGANSYLGDNTKAYLEKNGGFQVDVLDMLNSNWRDTDFSKYDVVFNVCAIVHRPKEKDISLYYKVNRDLAVELACLAKHNKVRQFIQTSTDGVFGIELGEMNSNKGFNPKTPYEKSKYEADLLLEQMRDNNFKVCIVRPPMIYGKGCKGNFPRLETYAQHHTFFPSIKNKRDMIFIGNMCNFVKFAIDLELDETCYPRNSEYVCVSSLISKIAKLSSNKMHLLWILNPFVKILYKTKRSLRSLFGNCYCTEPVCSKDWNAPFSLQESLLKMYKEK